MACRLHLPADMAHLAFKAALLPDESPPDLTPGAILHSHSGIAALQGSTSGVNTSALHLYPQLNFLFLFAIHDQTLTC